MQVSAYVANLAAFLTRSRSGHVDTIESAIAQGMKVCAHPALEDDLQRAHPDANFVFNEGGREIHGMVDDYVAGYCGAMAVGKMDSLGDLPLMERFCENDLVFTESVVIENVSSTGDENLCIIVVFCGYC